MGWLSGLVGAQALSGTLPPPSSSCPGLLFGVLLAPFSDYIWVRLQAQIWDVGREWGKGLSCHHVLAWPHPSAQEWAHSLIRSDGAWARKPGSKSFSLASGTEPEPTVHLGLSFVWEWGQWQGTRGRTQREKLGIWWGYLESSHIENQSHQWTYPLWYEAIIPLFKNQFGLDFLILATKRLQTSNHLNPKPPPTQMQTLENGEQH